ncbi:hypothetical protein [uncultured Alistipes sp.]|jgi:hypothetical protein|uniref:rolling circle replication-associated protein n=1 Tax=uncultured Alistipes sp. TaxID=538949 RepID=UPI0025CCCA65|nr:hypothetical protein [uncultured Alistipes sp.]
MCFFPKRIRNPAYEDLKDCQHRSPFVGAVDSPFPPDFILFVPCGQCWQCLRQKRFEMVLRLKVEQAVIPKGTRSYFVTLTFDDFHLADFREDYVVPVRRWCDKLRKRYGRFRFWFLSELGSVNGRLHFHGIIFGLRDLPYQELIDSWTYGFSWFGKVDNATCGYVTKYMLKQQTSDEFEYRPYRFSTKSIGCGPDGKGLDFLRSNLGYFDPQVQGPFPDCITFPGELTYSYAIPRYYFEKLFGYGSTLTKRYLNYSLGTPYTFRGRKFSTFDEWYSAIKQFRVTKMPPDLREKFKPKVPFVPVVRLSWSQKFEYITWRIREDIGDEFLGFKDPF